MRSEYLTCSSEWKRVYYHLAALFLSNNEYSRRGLRKNTSLSFGCVYTFPFTTLQFYFAKEKRRKAHFIIHFWPYLAFLSCHLFRNILHSSPQNKCLVISMKTWIWTSTGSEKGSWVGEFWKDNWEELNIYVGMPDYFLPTFLTKTKGRIQVLSTFFFCYYYYYFYYSPLFFPN